MPDITTVTVIEALTDDECARRERLEAVIESHLDSFIRVAIALAEIKRDQLWRSTHPSFAAYCDEKLGRQKSNAYALASAGEVIANLSDTSEELPMPTAYRQVKPLQKLAPAEQQQAWKAAIAISLDRQPTEKTVERAANAVQAKAPAIQPGQSMIVQYGEYAGELVRILAVDGVLVEGLSQIGDVITLLTTELIEADTPAATAPKTTRTGQASEAISSLETRLKIERARIELLESLLRRGLNHLPTELRLEALKLL